MSDGIAVEAGDILTLKGWSNATASIRALVNFRPTEWYRRIYQGLSKALVGSSEAHSLQLDVDLASSRAQGTVNYTITEDGVIDDAVINYSSSTALTRGQCYVQLLLQRNGTTMSVTSLLAAGYVYGGNTNGGHLASLNHITEPGPGAGHGHIRSLASADPAAGSEIAAQGPPTGSIWRLEMASVQIVQGITQTPLPTLVIDDGTNILSQIPAMPTALAASTTAELSWGKGLVQTSFTAVIADEIYTAPIPDALLLDTGDRFRTVTDGIGANTNYGPMRYQVQEWVMPN